VTATTGDAGSAAGVDVALRDGSRRATPALRGTASFSPSAGPPVCAWSDRTVSAFATPIRRSRGRALAGPLVVGVAGDKADLSSNDFLQFWEADERTDAIVLYLESFGNPRTFGQIARRVSSSKPVIAVKSGRSAAGRRAASSHTGAMVAAGPGILCADALVAQGLRVEPLGDSTQRALWEALPLTASVSNPRRHARGGDGV
jgi:hypothetical protein